MNETDCHCTACLSVISNLEEQKRLAEELKDNVTRGSFIMAAITEAIESKSLSSSVEGTPSVMEGKTTICFKVDGISFDVVVK